MPGLRHQAGHDDWTSRFVICWSSPSRLEADVCDLLGGGQVVANGWLSHDEWGVIWETSQFRFEDDAFDLPYR
jgi:hypothetical protein